MTEQELNQLSLQEIRELADVEANAEPEEQIFKRVVGGQEFSASSILELNDLIADAAEELLAENAKTRPAPVEAEETDDSRFVESQLWASSPDKAFESRFLKTTGMSSKDFKKQIALTVERESATAAEMFVEQTPAYLAIPANGAVLQSLLKKQEFEGKRLTVADITKAYEECRNGGLLQEREDPFKLSLSDLKARANQTPVVNDEAGDSWDF
jgi:hypothetical protein